MYKLISIAIIVLLLGSGCSGIRKASVSAKYSVANLQDTVVLGRVYANNMSKDGFFIKRADIEVITGEQSEKIVATIRKNSDLDYLISIKSKTGIEAARIFLGRDTVMINDRLNKVLYTGSSEYLEKKYSVTGSLFPLIFGDFVKTLGDVKSDSACVGGKFNYWSSSKGVKVSYVIDCQAGKVVSAIVEARVNKRKIIFLYSEFQKYGDLSFPGKIEVSGLPDDMELMIDIKSIEVPWNGDMTFIPGTRYEIIKLK